MSIMDSASSPTRATAPLWGQQANCIDEDPLLFEHSDDLSIEESQANFDTATEICIECPVFFQCGESATDADRYWTVRAGMPPVRFMDGLRRAEGTPTPRGAGVDRTCGHGHYVPGGGICRDCRSAINRRQKEK